MNSKTFFFVALPLLTNISLAIGAAFFGTKLAGNPGLRYFTVATAAAASLVGMGRLAIHDIGRVKAIASLFSQAITLICVFAAVYQGFGIGGAKEPVSFSTAIYFSVVTWTTLGYGDLRPLEELRILAAIEAALGYLYLGLIVGLIGGLLNKPN